MIGEERSSVKNRTKQKTYQSLAKALIHGQETKVYQVTRTKKSEHAILADNEILDREESIRMSLPCVHAQD